MSPTESLDPIGLGTWQNTDSERCVRTVRTALEMGYRHIDTAQIYDNEAAVGRGIRTAETPRDDVFLATKVAPSNLAPDDLQASVDESLQRLQVDYVDLLYVHWPAGEYDASATLPALDALREEGRIQHVGLSNFTPDLLEEARRVLDAPVFAHQVEMHPLLPQKHLRRDARERDTYLVAYSPFRHGTLFDHPVLNEVADRHNVSVARAILAWVVSHPGVVTIPKAVGKNHLHDNLAATELTLDSEDLERINAIEERDRYIDPPFAPNWS